MLIQDRSSLLGKCSKEREKWISRRKTVRVEFGDNKKVKTDERKRAVK